LGDRDSTGKFTKGHKPLNKGKGGRLPRAVEEKYRRAFSSTVKVSDFKHIILTALSRAKAGDLGMVRLFFEYALGKPKQPVEIEGQLFRLPDVIEIHVKQTVENRGQQTDSQPPPGPE